MLTFLQVLWWVYLILYLCIIAYFMWRMRCLNKTFKYRDQISKICEPGTTRFGIRFDMYTSVDWDKHMEHIVWFGNPDDLYDPELVELKNAKFNRSW